MLSGDGLGESDTCPAGGTGEDLGAAGEVDTVGLPIQKWGRFNSRLIKQTTGVVESVGLAVGIEPVASHSLTAGFGHML